jgi:hypothetical protein
MYLPDIRPIHNPSAHLIDNAPKQASPWGSWDDYALALEVRAMKALKKKKNRFRK